MQPEDVDGVDLPGEDAHLKSAVPIYPTRAGHRGQCCRPSGVEVAGAVPLDIQSGAGEGGSAEARPDLGAHHGEADRSSGGHWDGGGGCTGADPHDAVGGVDHHRRRALHLDPDVFAVGERGDRRARVVVSQDLGRSATGRGLSPRAVLREPDTVSPTGSTEIERGRYGGRRGGCRRQGSSDQQSQNRGHSLDPSCTHPEARATQAMRTHEFAATSIARNVAVVTAPGPPSTWTSPADLAASCSAAAAGSEMGLTSNVSRPMAPPASASTRLASRPEATTIVSVPTRAENTRVISAAVANRSVPATRGAEASFSANTVASLMTPGPPTTVAPVIDSAFRAAVVAAGTESFDTNRIGRLNLAAGPDAATASTSERPLATMTSLVGAVTASATAAAVSYRFAPESLFTVVTPRARSHRADQ